MILLLAALLADPAAGADVGGRVETHVRMAVRDCGAEDPAACALLDFGDTVVLGGHARVPVTTGATARLAVDLRVRQDPTATLLQDTSDPGRVLPLSLRVGEAVLDLERVGTKAVDLRLGVQRAAWGVADGLHVVDRLNPWDLENPLALDARLPVPMARALVHRGPVELQVAWVPVPYPAVLPLEGVDLAPDPAALLDDAAFEGGFSGADIREVEARIAPPAAVPGNMGAGVRLAWTAPVADLALVFVHGHDSLPQADGTLTLTGFQTSTSRVDVAVPLVYPRVDVAGVEARGELPGEVGAWVEAALVLPQATEVVPDAAQLEALVDLGTLDAVPDPLPVVVTQDGAPYPTWVAGIERSFGRFYLNLQWLHGFPTERRGADLREYALLGLRLTLGDRLVLETRGLAELAGQGWMASGDLTFLHADAARVGVGAAWVEGAPGTALAAFEGASHVGLHGRLDF